jgi:archaellum component FlaF (FlaF/FlaG flagellin family)
MIEFISQHVGDAAMFIGFLICVGILAVSSEAIDQPQLESNSFCDL